MADELSAARAAREAADRGNGAAAAAPPLPTELQIEVTGACNLACEMCLVAYRPKLGKKSGAMCFHLFKEIVDSLPELERLVMQGLGEPLLAPDFFEMLEYATGRGIRVGFNTNGTFLTPEAAERIVRAGTDWVHVSLDGATAETYEAIRHGADFELVTANIRGLTATMRRLGAPRPTIQLVFVAMRRNVHELPELVRLAAVWGVPTVWVQNLSHSFGDTDPAGAYGEIRAYARREALWEEPDGEMERAFAAAAAVADAVGVDLRVPRLREPPLTRAPGKPACHWPFTSTYVMHDGRVQPCCMVMGADRAVLGDVREDDFATIWRGSDYASFRAGLVADAEPPDVCRGCSLYRHVF